MGASSQELRKTTEAENQTNGNLKPNQRAILVQELLQGISNGNVNDYTRFHGTT
jgi:hypothetical protein